MYHQVFSQSKIIKRLTAVTHELERCKGDLLSAVARVEILEQKNYQRVVEENNHLQQSLHELRLENEGLTRELQEVKSGKSNLASIAPLQFSWVLPWLFFFLCTSFTFHGSFLDLKCFLYRFDVCFRFPAYHVPIIEAMESLPFSMFVWY